MLVSACKAKDTQKTRDLFNKVRGTQNDDQTSNEIKKETATEAKAVSEAKKVSETPVQDSAAKEMEAEKEMVAKESMESKKNVESKKSMDPKMDSSDKVASGKLDNSLLWKISGNGLAEPSYLYGTIHIISAEDYFVPDGTLTAMDASKKVVFEIDMNEMNDISSQMGLLQGAFMKDNKTLKDVMSAEDYELVKAHFKKMGLPLFMFEKMKPMLLTVFASGDINPSDLQTGKIKSYEMEFLEIANKSKKEIKGLETLEFQMSIFDAIPYEDQATMLVETIQSSDTNNDQFKEMVDMYKSQDIEAMIEMFEEEEGGLEGYDDVLVVQRNKNWIPIMGEMMADSKTFFAVGAGHLGGKEGVIRLLQSEGYDVVPYSE